MIEFENTIRVNRPVNEVFAFLSDFENIPKWNYFVIRVKKLSGGPIQVGTLYHQVRNTDEQDFQVIEFDPNHQMTVKTLPNSTFDLEVKFTLENEGDSTYIRDERKLDTGLPALLEKLEGRNFKSAVAENLSKLKQLLEEGKVVLQDGRLEHLSDT